MTSTSENVHKLFIMVATGILALVIQMLSGITAHILYGFVPVIIAVTFSLLLMKKSKLELDSIGLNKDAARKSVLPGLLIALSILSALFVAWLLVPSLFVDSRYNRDFSSLMLYVLIYIPLHTVFAEEFIFRGVLFGYAKKRFGAMFAAISSSVAFGLWHAISAQQLRNNQSISTELSTSVLSDFGLLIGTIIFTSMGGMLFSFLRYKYNSLLPPILAHYSLNASGVILVWLAQK